MISQGDRSSYFICLTDEEAEAWRMKHSLQEAAEMESAFTSPSHQALLLLLLHPNFPWEIAFSTLRFVLVIQMGLMPTPTRVPSEPGLTIRIFQSFPLSTTSTGLRIVMW